MNRENLINGLMVRTIVNTVLCSLISTNLFVLVWNGDVTPLERGIFVVVSDAVAMIASGFGESVALRRFLIRNYVKIEIGLTLADFALMPLIYVSGLTYFLTSLVLTGGCLSLLFRTIADECREILCDEGNERITFSRRREKMHYGASIVGAALSFIVPLSEWGIGYWICGAIAAYSICTIITAIFITKIRRYNAAQGIKFSCEE